MGNWWLRCFNNPFGTVNNSSSYVTESCVSWRDLTEPFNTTLVEEEPSGWVMVFPNLEARHSVQQELSRLPSLQPREFRSGAQASTDMTHTPERYLGCYLDRSRKVLAPRTERCILKHVSMQASRKDFVHTRRRQLLY